MGGRATVYPMGISNHSLQVNLRNPYSMSYGAEAVIPIETSFLTLRTQSFNSSNNDELLERSLDLIEERRESEMVQLAYISTNSNRATMSR